MPSGKGHQSTQHKNKYVTQFLKTRENKRRHLVRCDGRIDLCLTEAEGRRETTRRQDRALRSEGSTKRKARARGR